MSEFYPLLRHYIGDRLLPNPHSGLEQFASAPVRRAFAETTTAQDLTCNLFGKTRYRRDLVKAVAQSSLPSIDVAHQFRGLVPIDWVVDFLRNPRNEGRIAQGADVRPMLRRLDQRSLRNLLISAADRRGGDPFTNPWLMNDIAQAQLPADTELPRVRTWTELHDTVAARHRALAHVDRKKRIDSLKPVELIDEALALNGTTEGGLEIQIADHETTLLEWGDAMGNCIYGYGSQMRSGRSWLGGIYSNGHLVGNFEVSAYSERVTEGVERTLLQLLGRFNQPLDQDLRDDVEEYLQEHGVHVERYLGRAMQPDGGIQQPVVDWENHGVMEQPVVDLPF